MIDKNILLKYVIFKTARSGGAGGQHVNKVSSKVILTLDISSADCFTQEQKELLFIKLGNQLLASQQLQVTCQESRSQLLNKEKAVEKLMLILQKAFYIPKARKATKTPKSIIEKRLKTKKIQSDKKSSRKLNFDL